MKERPKLGRGLRDVSTFFLSETPQNGTEGEEPVVEAPRARSICICCPASLLIQSSLVANIALELARHRLYVLIGDFSKDPELRISCLMGSLIPENESVCGISRVRLYGLPDILIMDKTGDEPAQADQSAVAHAWPAEEGIQKMVLVNPDGSLDFICEGDTFDEYLICMKTHENSLLQGYAYIKAIHMRCPASAMHVAIEQEDQGMDVHAVFDKFSGFIQDRMGLGIDYFGTLKRDEHLERAVLERRPLVLSNCMSGAKDSFIGISASLLGAGGYKGRYGTR